MLETLTLSRCLDGKFRGKSVLNSCDSMSTRDTSETGTSDRYQASIWRVCLPTFRRRAVEIADAGETTPVKRRRATHPLDRPPIVLGHVCGGPPAQLFRPSSLQIRNPSLLSFGSVDTSLPLISSILHTPNSRPRRPLTCTIASTPAATTHYTYAPRKTSLAHRLSDISEN